MHQSRAQTVRIGLVLRKGDLEKKKDSAAYKVPKEGSTGRRPRHHDGQEQIERLMALEFSRKRIGERD